MNQGTADQEAEELLRLVAGRLTLPRDGECLLCFVVRMLDEFGCDTTLRFAKRYRDVRAPRATAMEARMSRVGGFCDCEIFLNGMTFDDHLLERDEWGDLCAPDPTPRCRLVRSGSTRAGSNWARRRSR